MHLLQTFLFWTSNFDDSPFLSQLTKERVMYLKRKLCIVKNYLSFEIGWIFVMRAYETKRLGLDLYGTPCNSTYTEDGVDERIVAAITHSNPMANKK